MTSGSVPRLISAQRTDTRIGVCALGPVPNLVPRHSNLDHLLSLGTKGEEHLLLPSKSDHRDAPRQLPPGQQSTPAHEAPISLVFQRLPFGPPRVICRLPRNSCSGQHWQQVASASIPQLLERHCPFVARHCPSQTVREGCSGNTSQHLSETILLSGARRRRWALALPRPRATQLQRQGAGKSTRL